MNGDASHFPDTLRRKRLRWLLKAGGILFVLAALATTMTVWLFNAESGLRVVLGVATHLSGGMLRAEGVEGTLRGPFSVSRLTLDLPEAKIEFSGLACDWQPSDLFSRKLAITRLRIEEVDVFLQESETPSEPLSLPESLRLPLDVNLAAMEIGRFRLIGHDPEPANTNAAPLFVLTDARLSLIADATRFHLQKLAVSAPQGRVEAEGELGTLAPHTLRVSGQFGGIVAGEELSVQIEGEGGLAEPVLRLWAQGQGVQGKVTLVTAPFEAMPVKTLELELDGVNPAAFAPDLPQAELQLRANLATGGADNAPVLLHGPVRIANSRPATLDADGLPVSALSMKASINAGLDELRFDEFVLEGGGGKLLGWLRWRKASENGDAQADATLPGGLGRIEANFEVEGVDPSRVDSRLPSRRVDARLEMDATEMRQQGRLSLSTGGMQVEGEGEILASAANAPVFVLNLNLHDFNPAAFFPASPPASIKLNAALTGTLTEKPTVAVHYTFGESRFNGKPLAGKGFLTWDGSRVRNADLEFDIAGNRLKLAGGWGEIHDLLTFELDAPRLGDIGLGLGGKLRGDGTVTGALEAPAGALKISAEKLNLPDVLEIASVTGNARIDVGDSGTLSLNLKASGVTAGDVRLSTATLTAEGRRDRHQIQAGVDGKFDKTPLTLKTALEGGLQGVRWQGRLAALESTGHWALRLRAPATMVLGFDPEEFSLLEAEFDITPAPVPARSSRSSRNADAADAPLKPGYLHIIETRWKDDSAVLRGKLTGLPATQIPVLGQGGRRNPLVLGADWDLQLGNSVEGQARIFRETGDFTVRGELSTRLGLERFEAYLIARQRKLTFALATHGTEFGELGVSLEVGIERFGKGWRLAPHAPLSGAARLNMPSIAWLGRLSRENIEIGGLLEGDVTLSGTPDTPRFQGQVKGNGLQFSLVDQGLLLAGGELEARFVHHDGRQRLRITKLEFESPNRVTPDDRRLPVRELTATPGRLSVTGNIAIGARDQTQAAQRGRLEFTAERLPLLQRPDRWLIVSGEGQVGLQEMALDVQAQLRVDAGYFAIDDMLPPSLGDDVVVRSNSNSNSEEENVPSAEDGEGIAISGNIAIDLGRALYLSAFGVDTRLMGSLNTELRPHEPPRTLGAIRTIGGTWRGYGQHLKIESGSTITFLGDSTNPALNITAMRRGPEVEAGVMITGDVRRPIVKLVSEPAVPEHEKLSWLILGRAPDSGGSDMALLLPAAQALFGGGMSDDVGSKLGFDTFTIGPGELNSSSRTAASRVVGSGFRINAGPKTESEVVTVGRRINNDLSLSFEQSLGGAESLVKLTYRFSRELSFVARGGTENALDMYYTYIMRSKEWREREKARQEERKRAREIELEAASP
jgi:translocation and assembly module TamB